MSAPEKWSLDLFHSLSFLGALVFSPWLAAFFSQEEQNQCPGQSQATEYWANTHKWVHLWLLLIPRGSPNNPASPFFQCVSLSFCYEAPQRSLRTWAAAPGARMTARVLGSLPRRQRDRAHIQFLQGPWGYKQTGGPQKSKGQPRRLPKTLRFLSYIKLYNLKLSK